MERETLWSLVFFRTGATPGVPGLIGMVQERQRTEATQEGASIEVQSEGEKLWATESRWSSWSST